MAEKKKTSAKKTASKKTVQKTAKKEAPASAKRVDKAAERAVMKKRDENSTLHRVMPGIYGVFAALLAVCLVFNEGKVGTAIHNAFFGLFGLMSIAIPFMLVYFAIKWRSWVAELQHTVKWVFFGFTMLFAGALVQLIFIAVNGVESDFAIVSSLYSNGYLGAGVILGTLGVLLEEAVGVAGAIVLAAAGTLIFGVFLFGFTPKDIWINIKYNMRLRAERRAELEKQRAEREYDYEEETDDIAVPPEMQDPFDENQPFITAVPDPEFDMNIEGLEEYKAEVEDDEEDLIISEEDANVPPIDLEAEISAIVTAENGEGENIDDEGGGVDISHALKGAEGETLTVEKTDMSEAEEFVEKPKPIKEKAVYHFPPVSMLAVPEKKKVEDVGTELRTNAQKLVETLRSFKVNVSISSVSRGPTITRYELIPEAGTRVRAIANLVDDISLALATSGIRIEAPIPGKAAVGIEVPNRVVSTVALRELIDSPAFMEAKSKLTVCLGKDVGGTPIMFDISKMPHLLIAGATGMGKSVCINSIITSILYKATPDEVKLILIDPKKVEFNIYNGIPHLQIPVVSDPKKAAGALHWAVTEMERRYELIEEANTRKIEPYNEYAKKNGGEVLPYIVIIIDELADLMMTAPDAVEDSICRLAQKARAAGMHVIIGTQRPSVDVITGLIKANIPSRIAFTVASQVDSRTIIDIAGAEKLIGKGDMLYYPVGLSKPMRAQGAFVSDDEVERITEFVKQAGGESEYDADIIESIEREAMAIGQSKSKGGDGSLDDGTGDPKLRDALEIATDLGKISTSLLQRKLSIGYGRAAKIIDIMESRGFVSAPDGQKPREVLVTKTQFREMVVNNDERIN